MPDGDAKRPDQHRQKYRSFFIMNRFWSKVKQGALAECWEWQAATNKNGYGSFWFDGKTLGAHRVAYELTNGSIPGGLKCCHTCDNPACVNPNHLWLGTDLDNARDRDRKGRGNQPVGSGVGISKLTTDKVLEIREKYATGSYTQDDIAKTMNISQTQVARIVNRKQWRHI